MDVGSRLKCALLAALLAGALHAPAATFIWNGAGGNNNWSTAANWTGGVAPANNGTAGIILAGTTQLSPNVDVAWDITSLSFSNTAGAFVLGGSALNIRVGGITNSSANAQTINNAITLATNQVWNATSGRLTFNGNINNVTNLLTISGSFNTTIGGILSGTGGLTKTGTGTNTLTGANTYSGVTTISAGAINIQNGAALGSTSAGTVVASGSTLQLQGGVFVTNESLTLSGTGVSALGALRNLSGDNSWGGVITLGAASTIACDANNLTLSGGIVNSTFLTTFTGVGNILVPGIIGSGTGGVTKSGTGTLTLSGTNSYGGLTTVSAGVLNVQNSAALGTTALGTTVASGAALQLQGGVDVAGETLSVSGTGISSGGAFRNLSGSNSWSGTLTLIAASTLNADAGTLFLGANIVNGTLLATFTNNGTINLAGVLGGGTGGLTKNGTGTLIVNGVNTYTGATTINGGVLQFGATGALSPTTAVTVNAAGTLDLNGLTESILSLAGAGSVTLGSGTLTVNNSAATTFSGVMSGTGGLVKAGTATFTLSGVNLFIGGTTINAGTISIKADNNLGDTNGVLTLNGGTLASSVTLTSVRAITLGVNNGTVSPGGTTLTLSGNISGPGALTKIGTKTLALTGNNSYLGGTTNSAGTITVNSDARLGDADGPFTFSASATLTTTASFSSSRNIFLNAGTATFSAGTGFTNTLSGVISGPGLFTKAGTGVLQLNGNNTFTNTLTLSAGTLRLGGNERLSDLLPLNITASSATFDVNGFTETIGSLASSAAGKVTLGNGFLTAGGNSFSTTFTGVISGNGGFTKAGSGTQILSGANTYTNTTTVSSGTLQISANDRIANTSPVVVNSGAIFNLNNFNETIGSLAGAGTVTLGSGTLTAGNTSTTTFSGAINGTGAFTKVGSGKQIFSGTNSYSGATSINVGNLQINGSSSNSPVTIAANATLSGTGIAGTVAVNTSSTNAPGTVGTGTLSSGSQTWASGGNYVWEINNASGTKGASDGWDWLNISGSLTINANFGNKFTIRIASLNPANAAGQVTNFDNTVTYIWTIASASGGITGFDSAKFTLNTSAFQNPLGAGAFAITQTGNDLNLIFTTLAQATIKAVQRGNLTSSGSGTNTAPLGTPINTTKAFLIFNTRHDSSTPGGSMVRGRIASTNSVEFVRETSEGSPINIQWYVIEYAAGVSVQRGEITQTNTVINVPLTPLSSVSQAFATWSKTPELTATAFDDSDPLVAEITATTNLQFRVGVSPVSAPVIWWQVIEFPHPASLNVQKGSITNLTGTNLLATATLATPVDTNSTFLLTSYRTAGSGTSVGARMLRAQLTDVTTITVDRSIAGAPDDITEFFWQAVQLKDGSSVQRGTVNFASGVAQTNVSLISLNTNRAAAFASVQSGGGQNLGRSPSTGSVLGVGAATLAFNSISQLALDRNNTSTSADVGWTVVGFGPTMLVPATGGAAISADAKGGTYTNLTGPLYTEGQNGNVGVGTIILKVPTGFIFDTAATLPTVLITRVTGSGADALNINGVASGTAAAMTSLTTTSLTFTVTAASSGGVNCSLTWQNIRVRPSAGTPLASGNIISAGTSIIQGVTTNASSFGFLAEVVGSATKLILQTPPSSTAVAGVEFAQQPVIQIQDQFGNLRSGDNATVVTVGINTGTGSLQGPATVTAVGGVAAFDDLSYEIAETIKLGFTASGLTGVNSGNIAVSPAPASQLTIKTQPSSSVTAGVLFPQQPAVRVEDAFGNLRSSDNSMIVSVDLDQGTDDLRGTLTAKASSGVATFTNLSYQIAETITLAFTSSGLDPDTSAGVVVNPAAAGQLTIQTQPSSTATAGLPFARQPVVRIEDQFGNLRSADNSTVVTATRNAGGGNLLGTVTATASGGVATFANLAHPTATTITIDFTSGALTGNTSADILINPGNVAQLAFSAQPGSATVGSIFGAQPALITQDAYGNTSIVGLSNNLDVVIALTSGTGALRGTTNLNIGTGAGNGTVVFTDLRVDSAGSGKALTASASGLTSAVSASFTVAQKSVTGSVTANNKIYDGSTTATIATRSLSGVVGGQDVNLTGGTATFADKNVGTNKTVTATGLSLSGNDAGNYVLASSTATTTNNITPVALTVSGITADNKIYDGTNTATLSLNNVTLADVLSGDTVSLITNGYIATFADAEVGTGKTVTVSGLILSGSSAANYSLTQPILSADIGIAGSVNALGASANPSLPASNVTFTATLIAPGGGTPTGNVQFRTNGIAFGTPVTLNSGVAAMSTALLTHGSNTVVAEYSGDGNLTGSTNSLVQLVNTSPLAPLVTLERSAGASYRLRIANLLTNCSDADGDAFFLASVGNASTNGAVITTNTTFIFYTPSATNGDVTDSFTYTVGDAFGGAATGTLLLTLKQSVAQTHNIISLSFSNGAAILDVAGIPGRAYLLQATTNMLAPTWETIGTNVAGTNGLFKFCDLDAANCSTRCYRTATQ